MSVVFSNLKLNEACKEQHHLVLERGFEPQPVAVKLMLIVSELSEALEADRKNRHADFKVFGDTYELEMSDFAGTFPNRPPAYKTAFEAGIKDTFEDELADAFMRLMDLCGEYNIDIEKHIHMKAQYNELRPPKHGKEY